MLFNHPFDRFISASSARFCKDRRRILLRPPVFRVIALYQPVIVATVNTRRLLPVLKAIVTGFEPVLSNKCHESTTG